MHEPTPSGGLLNTATGALMLREEVFRARARDPRPLWNGALFVIAVYAIVAGAGIVGAALTEWTSPDLGALQEAVLAGVMDMPWREQVPPEALDDVQRSLEQSMALAWGIARALQPSVASAVAALALSPLGALVGWLVYGVLAFTFARLLSGTGTLAQTYGTTSLAAAPQLLGVVHVLPYVQTAGIGVWSIICAYLAVKHTHGLSPGRAFWATVLPLVTVGALVALLAAAVGAVAVLAISQSGAAQ